MSEKIVQLNEEVIKGQLKELVRGSVEETLNGLLEAEAEKLTQAGRYERNEQRQGYRSGHYTLVLAISPVLLLRPCIALTFSGVCTFTLLKSEEAIPPTLTMQVVNGVNFS